MHTASSAKRTWSEPASASENTATVAIPSSRQARMTRMAISPRLAINTLRNMASGLSAALLDLEQLLAELDALAALDQHFEHGAGKFGLDLVHQLHGLDDAQRLTLFDRTAHGHEVLRLGRGRSVKRAHERRGHEHHVRIGRFG